VQVGLYIGLYIGGTSLSLSNGIYWFAINVFVLIKKYKRYLHELRHFKNTNKRQREEKELKAIVSNLLPAHILQQMRQHSLRDKARLTDEFSDVSILFADMSGFTDYCKQNGDNIQKCVNLVRALFESFDRLVQEHNLYKMYTIGDCYVIISFVNGNNRESPVEECKNLVKVGLEMIKIIQRTADQERIPNLAMRIGIHTGSFVGGVLGTEIVRYDIYGEDVLIANNMESEGKINRVHISDKTYHLLQRSQTSLGYRFEDGEKFVNKELGIDIKTHFILEDGQ
jgi:phospholipid-translocating ATPase